MWRKARSLPTLYYHNNDEDSLSFDLSINENAQRYAVTSIVRNWAKQDIEKTGQWINSLSDGKARDDGVKSLVSTLSNKNPASAFDWAETISNDSQRLSSD